MLDTLKTPKAGLLPLYLRLYDDVQPDMRIGAEAFHALIASRIADAGIETVNVPVCRVKEEADDAVSLFETEGVDCVIVLELSYSPSLEAVYALSRTALPVILLAATPDRSIGFDSATTELIYNQGLLGLQDLAAMLRRSGKDFTVIPGHPDDPGFIAETAMTVRAAQLGRRLRSARVGSIGDPFRGMGDIQLGGGKMKELLGIEQVKFDLTRDPWRYSMLGDAQPSEAEAMADADAAVFGLGFEKKELIEAERVWLGLRRWTHDNRLDAVTMNFIPQPKNNPFPHVPQLAMSKLMGEGIGVSGEGDLMSASLCAALMGVYSDCTTVSMYSPDWQGGTVYLSCRAGVNPRCLSGRPVICLADEPLIPELKISALTGTLRPGKAAMVSLSPQEGDRFTLTVITGEMLDAPQSSRRKGRVCGWFRPDTPLSDLIRDYSESGGPHHLVLAYGAACAFLAKAARLSGFGFIQI